MPFDLVRGRVDPRRGVDAFEVLDAKVGHADGFDLARLGKLEHRLPGLGQRWRVDNEDLIFLWVLCEELAWREGDGPVNDCEL